VGIAESSPTSVRLDQLVQLRPVDEATTTRKITGLVMSPQCSLGKLCDLLAECAPVGSPLATGNGSPMKGKRATVGVAT